jgi:uncharacterized membrane protein YhiD involved in acid resistance
MESTTTFTNSFLQGLGIGTGLIVAAGTAVFVMGNAFVFYRHTNKSTSTSDENTEETLQMKNLTKTNSDSCSDIKTVDNTVNQTNVFKQIFDDLE